MIKKLVKIILLGLIILLASKGFIAFTAYQAISKLKDKHSGEALFTYQWISSSFDGVVSIKGVSITPYAMKRTFVIDEIRFVYDSYMSLLTDFPVLGKGQLKGLKRVFLPNIQTELKGKSTQSLLATNISSTWFTPFNLYGCGDYTSLSAKEYELMGIKQHEMAFNFELDQNAVGSETVSVRVDGHELGELSMSVSLPKNSFQQLLKNDTFSDLKLHSLFVEYQDAGFFRRLNILCNQNGPENRALFSMAAASEWKDTMFSKGLFINETLVKSYSNYLLQGGTLSLEASSKEGIKVSNFVDLVDKELFSHFDASVFLNGKKIESPQLYLDSETLFPPPAVVAEPTTQVIDVPKPQAGYRVVAIELAAEHIDRKIRVVMKDGKEYEGLLTQTSEYNLELTQNITGGAVHYPLMFNQIETFEVWFN